MPFSGKKNSWYMAYGLCCSISITTRKVQILKINRRHGNFIKIFLNNKMIGQYWMIGLIIYNTCAHNNISGQLEIFRNPRV